MIYGAMREGDFYCRMSIIFINRNVVGYLFFVFYFLSRLLANQHHPRQLFTVSESASRCHPVAPTLDPFPIMDIGEIVILIRTTRMSSDFLHAREPCRKSGRTTKLESLIHFISYLTMRWKQEESKDLASTCVFVAMRLDLESSHRYLVVSPSVLVVRVRQCLPCSEA